MLNRAVFFDRDGTLNLDPGYIGDPDLIELYEGVPEGIFKLREEYEFKIIVASNQSGISRGLLTRQNVDSVNNKINDILKKHGTRIDAFYYCSYHPDFSSGGEINCRKPNPYMIDKAVEDFDIDRKSSYLVGDKPSDIECGVNAGIKTILVTNTINEEKINQLHKEGKSPNFIAENFTDACNYIIEDFSGGLF